MYDLHFIQTFLSDAMISCLLICSYYGKEADTLASLRHTRLMKSVTTSLTFRPQNLPPSERAIHFHALRIHLQVCEWSNLDLECLNPLDWGWYQMKDTLEPIKTDLEPVPVDMLNFIRCNCKTSSKDTCGPRLHVFMLSEWTEMCSSLR